MYSVLVLLGALSLLLLIVWVAEPRFFLFAFEWFAYRVESEPAFRTLTRREFSHHSQVTEGLGLFQAEFEAFRERRLRGPKAHEVDAYNGPISSAQGAAWRTMYLKVYNGWFEGNCREFPLTAGFFREIPEVTCVMFSVVEPGNTIPGHKGKLKGIFRYQLPLFLSSTGSCALTVNGESRQYKVGEPVFFDDNNPHSVTNGTPEDRVILFLDIQKPSGPVRKSLDDFFMRLVTAHPKFRKAPTQPQKAGGEDS